MVNGFCAVSNLCLSETVNVLSYLRGVSWFYVCVHLELTVVCGVVGGGVRVPVWIPSTGGGDTFLSQLN